MACFSAGPAPGPSPREVEEYGEARGAVVLCVLRLATALITSHPNEAISVSMFGPRGNATVVTVQSACVSRAFCNLWHFYFYVEVNFIPCSMYVCVAGASLTPPTPPTLL